MSKKAVVLVLVGVVFLWQCSHYDELQKYGKESSHGSSESHNFGQDCMKCHNDNKNEASHEAWWTIAGSVVNDQDGEPFTNGTIELWSQPNREGVLYYTIEIDALGNFYSEKIINFHGTCFPVIVDSQTGDYDDMDTAFHSGGCNSCHGTSEDVIESP